MEANESTLHTDAQAIAAEFKDYAYSVSHDLSAPIRAMVEFSKLLTNEHADSLNEEGKEYLELIIENGQKMQAMMDGLLQYSRLNTMAKPFTKVSVARLLADIRVVMQPQITASKAVIELDELPSITADFEQLMYLLGALLDNAIKFQHKGNIPQIKISAEKKNGFWQFAIADNGIGIKPQYQDKIFKLFARLHTDDEYPGVGIGLTLVQKIVQRHGGKIWYESCSQQGSVFYFTLQDPKRDFVLDKING